MTKFVVINSVMPKGVEHSSAGEAWEAPVV